MQVTATNDVKIYNLSVGKSMPEWLSERRRRKLVKQDIDLRRRIELIQDFDMPALSDNVKVSKDGQYVMATGVYKPRIRCFDLNNLGLKFERCLDSEVVQFEMLSDDYSKMVFLHCDRYVEFHAQHGRYYRMRIPKFGRDMVYHPSTCDLYFAGAGPDLYRLNLEQGRFLNPLSTEASGNNCLTICPENNLVLAGSTAGRVEAWDPRTRARVGVLDVALASVTEDKKVTAVPAVTCLQFKNALQMAVGTSTGQVLLYDLRSSRPLLTKDHMYGLPIKKVRFQGDNVMSMDAQVVKIWDNKSGKPYTSIESTAEFNDICVYPNSGLVFLANEQPKMQVFYIPSLGPAPRWASFLDSLTEELEESSVATVYDDYKFVTNEEISELGLDHLMGTQMLRAHMHGYFMDIRLFRKASSARPANNLDTIKQDLIKKKLEEQRAKRVQLKSSMPKVNKDLFLKLKDQQMPDKKPKKKDKSGNLLEDDRFGSLFTNPEFEVDTTEESYRLLNPVVSKLDNKRLKEVKKTLIEDDDAGADDTKIRESGESDLDDESSDDDQEWTKQVKKEHKVIQKERDTAKDNARAEARERKLKRKYNIGNEEPSENALIRKPKFSEVKSGNEFTEFNDKKEKKKKLSKVSLEERLESQEQLGQIVKTETGHTMTFQPEKPRGERRKEEEDRKHREERRMVRRSAKTLRKDKLPPQFWGGKRVR